MSLTLPGGNALVTGAASGIGYGVALAYAQAGVEGLLVSDINLASLEQTVEECIKVATHKDFRVIPFKVDVRQEEDVIAMVDTVVREFGRLDYAANVAGVGDKQQGTAEHPLSEFDNTQAINTRGVFICMQQELRAMQKNEPKSYGPGRPTSRGSIVNMGSGAANTVLTGMTSYVASKHAVAGLTKAAAVHHAKDSIRINSVAPVFILTAQVKALIPGIENMKAGTIDGRWGTPEEIADVVMFLSSPLSSFMQGTTVYADGGNSVMMPGC